MQCSDIKKTSRSILTDVSLKKVFSRNAANHENSCSALWSQQGSIATLLKFTSAWVLPQDNVFCYTRSTTNDSSTLNFIIRRWTNSTLGILLRIYLSQLNKKHVTTIEAFINRMHSKAHFYKQKDNKNNSKNFFVLKSDKTLPSIKEMQSFRKGFFKLVLKIKFRKIRCGYLVKFI